MINWLIDWIGLIDIADLLISDLIISLIKVGELLYPIYLLGSFASLILLFEEERSF
jgi:hypothetical protein